MVVDEGVHTAAQHIDEVADTRALGASLAGPARGAALGGIDEGADPGAVGLDGEAGVLCSMQRVADATQQAALEG